MDLFQTKTKRIFPGGIKEIVVMVSHITSNFFEITEKIKSIDLIYFGEMLSEAKHLGGQHFYQDYYQDNKVIL
jgi:hypothetical protein